VTVHLTATGPAAPETAWERYLRPELWSGWSPQIRRVDYAHPTLRPGTTGWVHGPWPSRVPFRVLEVDDPGRRWVWEVRLGPVRFRMVHAVTAYAAGSRTTLDIAAPAPLALAYAPLAQVALRRLVA
jgi:hypothetical protein